MAGVVVGVEAAVHACGLVAGARALAGLALLRAEAGLITSATMHRVGLHVDARVAAHDERIAAFVDTLAAGTDGGAGLIATATMLGVGVCRHAGITAERLALLAGQRARAIHAHALARTRMTTFTTMLGRGRRVDAELIADLIGRRTVDVANPIDAEFTLAAGSIARAAMREIGRGIDALPATRLLEAWTIGTHEPALQTSSSKQGWSQAPQ